MLSTIASPAPSALDRASQHRERSQVMDIVRGIAVIGMLLTNITFFATPLSVVMTRYWVKTPDHVASLFVTFFLSGKLYSIFSLLFGLGCAMYIQRARETGEGFSFYLRRMAVLFGLGIVHALLLSTGDILHTYAVLGLLLVFFTRLSNRALLATAAICITLPMLFSAGEAIMAARGSDSGAQSTADAMSAYLAQTRLTIRTYRQGTFREIVAQHAAAFQRRLVPVLTAAPHIMGMMLLGVYTYRRRIFMDVAQHRRLLWRIIAVTLPVGLLLNGLVIFASEFVAADMTSTVLAVVADSAYLAGASVFALLYAASAILWFAPRRDSRLAVWLAAVGRTALSNYVAQSLICNILFLSYGFALYGRFGPGTVVPWAVAIAVALTVLSVWWTRRFQHGPLEWLWRTLSYGRLQPFRAPPRYAGHKRLQIPS